MSFSPFAFARPIAFVATGLTALAIAVGRTAADRADERSAAPVRYYSINWYLFGTDDPSPRFLDAETGRVVAIPLGGTGYHKYLSCSPWRDARGQAQVVGLPGGCGPSDLPQAGKEIVLTRYSFPEGRLLDQLPMDTIIPTSAPCWFPGMSSRILFGAADGRLYRLSFPEARHTKDGERDDLLNPLPLAWNAPHQDGEWIWLSDPAWPTDSRFGGRIVVSLTHSGEVGPDAQPSGGKLWWLQLTADGRAIQDAGRLTAPGPETSERWPTLITTRSGELQLAYLARRKGEQGWRLRTALVTINSVTGAPHAGEPTPAGQEGEGLPFPPVFSADGRWVHVMTRQQHSAVAVEHFVVADGAAGDDHANAIRLTRHE
ncbi:MAG: hypothetical protein P4L84_14400 [Isosphaeraceae bacterium]|nr:hypothetical protein [Isosphaeraceae bacterium]